MHAHLLPCLNSQHPSPLTLRNKPFLSRLTPCDAWCISAWILHASILHIRISISISTTSSDLTSILATTGKLLSSSNSFLPWLSLVAIIWIQSISGTSFDFSAYSSQLKSRLGISQVKLNYLTVASDAGKLFGWCSGVAALYLSLPSILLIGGAIGAVGYGVQFLFLAGKIHSLSYWQALLLQLLAGNSICWINTASYVASMRKFHADRGAVVGISTSYSALSAKIYIAVYQVVLGAHGSDSLYLLLNAVTPLAVGMAMSPLIMDRVPSGEVSRSCLVAMFGIACVTGVYSVVATVVPEMEMVSERTPKVVLLVMVVAVVVVPMVKAVEWVRESKCKAMRVAEEAAAEGSVLTPEVVEEEEMEEEVREHSVRDLMLSVDFWLYFWVYLSGGTLGLVYMNNLGQISQSRGVGDTVLLSISSSFGFFGKLGTAPLMAFTRKRYMVSTPALMMMMMAPMSASFFLLLDQTTVSLFASTAIIGMCSGAMTSIAVSITAELFGSKHFGINHNIVIANIPIGSFLFGCIAGYIYDREGAREGAMGSTCMGARCFHKTFMLWGMICFLGTVLSVVLYLRTRTTSQRSQSVV